MLTKSQIKLITSLGQKKFRIQHQLFIVEGVKGIKEFLNSSLELHTLFTTEAIFDTQTQQTVLVTDVELKKLSALKTPNTALAVFKIPKPNSVNEEYYFV